MSLIVSHLNEMEFRLHSPVSILIVQLFALIHLSLTHDVNQWGSNESHSDYSSTGIVYQIL